MGGHLVAPQLKRIAQLESTLREREELDARRPLLVLAQLEKMMAHLKPSLRPRSLKSSPVLEASLEAISAQHGPHAVQLGSTGFESEGMPPTAPSSVEATDMEASTVPPPDAHPLLSSPKTPDAISHNERPKPANSHGAQGAKRARSARKKGSARRSSQGRPRSTSKGPVAQLVQPAWDWRPPRRTSPKEDLSMYNDAYQAASALQQLQLRDADEEQRSEEPRMERWRSRWDAKWAYGGESRTQWATHEPVVPGVRRERALAASATERIHTMSALSLASDLPRSHWDVVRARVGDIAQW